MKVIHIVQKKEIKMNTGKRTAAMKDRRLNTFNTMDIRDVQLSLCGCLWPIF